MKRTVWYEGGSGTVSKVEISEDIKHGGGEQFKVYSPEFERGWKVKAEELSDRLIDPASVKPMTPKQFDKSWKKLGLDAFEIAGSDEEEEEE